MKTGLPPKLVEKYKFGPNYLALKNFHSQLCCGCPIMLKLAVLSNNCETLWISLMSSPYHVNDCIFNFKHIAKMS
jgi:hypothetical protein